MSDARSSVEAAVGSFVAAMRSLFTAIPESIWHDSAQMVRYETGLPVPRFNGVVVLGPEADEGAATEWLDDLASRGLPRCILSRPNAPGWVPELAERHRLGHVEHEPLMLHTSPGTVERRTAGTVTRVDPNEASEVAVAQRLFADGFEGPVEVLGLLMSRAVLLLPEMSAYVGRADGEPCTTGFGALTDGHIGVFNIATPPTHRRQGHGQAVTAEVVLRGAEAGAHTAYLQASAMGYPIYERMGFRTVEEWPSYYPAE